MQISADLFQEPGQAHLSPGRFADVLGLDLDTLARALGVHGSTLRHHPESPRTQERLRDFVKVFRAMGHLGTNVTDVAFHMKNSPIPAFEYRTLFEVVGAGKVDDALRYLESMSGTAGSSQ